MVPWSFDALSRPIAGAIERYGPHWASDTAAPASFRSRRSPRIAALAPCCFPRDLLLVPRSTFATDFADDASELLVRVGMHVRIVARVSMQT